MATLTKVKSEPVAISTLALSVPTPFPKQNLAGNSSSVDISSHEQRPQLQESEPALSISSEVFERQETERQNGSLHELMPSIVHVERACIMALNNLLSLPVRWKTIVPDRRHSMPNAPQSSSSQAVEESSTSALHTLVSNLRTRDNEKMIQASSLESDTDLLQELHIRVNEISSSLETSDAELVKTLIALLSHLHRLSVLVNPYSPSPIASFWSAGDSNESHNLFDTLKRQLSDFQLERSTSQQDVVPRGSKPVLAVEATLLWSQIDQELDTVVSMCKERTEYLSYDPPDYEYDTLPVYDHESQSFIDVYDHQKMRGEASSTSPIMPGGQMSEKRRLDLEAVTMAIDRLYLVAPQLHNQRVELKSTKLAQMEKARRQGSSTAPILSRSVGKQKERDRDVKELENMFELINKASERSFKDQSVILDGGMQARLEKVRRRDIAKREAFVDQLAEHSDARRLHDQDALLQEKTKDPDAMLSLPEFIREAVPAGSLKTHNPKALLTLPEFIKEVPPPHIISSRSTSALPIPAPSGGALARLKSKSKNRDRSMSAPPLAWLRSSSSKSNIRESSPKVNEESSSPDFSFDVTYVAEFHETLHHVLVFFTVTGAQPGFDLEAEVVPSFSNNQADDGDRLIIKSGSKSSPPLILPARVVPGKQEIKVQSGHFEIKLAALSSLTLPLEPGPLLDATQLSNANPTSFICSMCSLQLIQSSKFRYCDLPSEHWEELVDAWMCHSSQTLNDNIVKNGRGGFWPSIDQALVGGSYILFEDSAMTKDNLHPDTFKGDDHRLVRCLCGSVLGRCQEHFSSDPSKVTAFKILKYAVRPVSASSEPIRIPLSAFIVEDMVEFVHAHASHRFVISDEEDERPRILIWLFKPSLQLAYATLKRYAIPKSSSMNVAKVLYKLIGPSEGKLNLKNMLEKYPGFPQAEYLFYPMDTCQRLAVLLKESNRTYPDNMRTMTGLEVGWLQRA
ncbi:HECT-like ubiquitin-conjugating enzyme-binding-domain-containing protein [Lentinula aciculospora]|uniref:HECT-like ubiquitin-conjugating enzyme-binding-domain-containing protein n=1 Tax=Lentinula aciculospora TaxID=153920 RepID=A0A9W9ATK1_9AGAR|nr:HECT-like ubiquitin-conjugating enzyme-binding-domain-containing protein [Lentinula aciculospora]